MTHGLHGLREFHGIPLRLFAMVGGLVALIAFVALCVVTVSDHPMPLMDTVDGLPVHPLVVHATVMTIFFVSIGVIGLAVRPKYRHKYGYLLLWLTGLMLASTWVAVESGQILTAYPGLGRTEHADGGLLLLGMLVPYAVLITAMVVMDRIWLVKVNRHGDLYRRTIKRHGKPYTWQLTLLNIVCVVTVIAAVLVMVQTGIVGHSGASASWSDFKSS